MEEDAAIAERLPADGIKEAGAGSEQVIFAERSVERISAAHQTLKHGVLDGHPFDDEVMPGEAVAEIEDGGEWDLFHQHEMADDGEHQDEVELAFEAGQQGDGLGVLPADRGRGTRDVRMDRLNGEAALAGHPEEAVG